jgi:hypothetical protein
MPPITFLWFELQVAQKSLRETFAQVTGASRGSDFYSRSRAGMKRCTFFRPVPSLRRRLGVWMCHLRHAPGGWRV